MDLELNLRQHFNSFNLPSFTEITTSLMILQDPMMVVTRTRLSGIFSVSLSLKFPTLSIITIIETKVHLTEPSQDKPGKLVTFVNSFTAGTRQIKNDVFDKVVAEYGPVLKCTEPQAYRNSSILNGNRYPVIDPRKTIPDSISILVGDHPNTSPLPGPEMVLPTLRNRTHVGMRLQSKIPKSLQSETET